MISEFSLLYGILATLQAVGLISTWMARRSEGSHRQTFCQAIFLAALAGLGCATIYAVLVNGTWLASGTILSVMVVTGTCEFRTSTGAARSA